ncbi:hypothetical protein F4821DRAFT_222508 [Hypoxylon rubiginosum]|uniref:Uncharacterized protein n=1 Tax=Hypoxylon rubiginosum TaxID=110542 RepID=A0ACC0DKC8_9PEZI|nr:hypothetical protein F4821DRAFT_222508 [Hypoxylon rubiginosum]
MGSVDSLPYWQINVPENDRTEECPEFLASLSDKDIEQISSWDSEYHIATWPEVQNIVAENRLGDFRRIPSELRRYFEYNWKLKRDHGSVMDFVLFKRLGWEAPVTPRGRPFEFEDDVKILWNDWPYGIDERIVHLVVWTKFDLAEDPVTTDLTDEARAEIEQYVQKTFGSRVPKDRYVWFKNWRSLKSVHAVEHFHVMLFNPDPKFIDEITNGDVPLCRKV